MSKVVYWIVAPPLALSLIIFFLNNRTQVVLDLWPLEILDFSIPLFSIALVCMAAGFLFGSLIVLKSLLISRRRTVHEARRANKAERELLVLEERLKKNQKNSVKAKDAIAKLPSNLA